MKYVIASDYCLTYFHIMIRSQIFTKALSFSFKRNDYLTSCKHISLIFFKKCMKPILTDCLQATEEKTNQESKLQVSLSEVERLKQERESQVNLIEVQNAELAALQKTKEKLAIQLEEKENNFTTLKQQSENISHMVEFNSHTSTSLKEERQR